MSMRQLLLTAEHIAFDAHPAGHYCEAQNPLPARYYVRYQGNCQVVTFPGRRSYIIREG